MFNPKKTLFVSVQQCVTRPDLHFVVFPKLGQEEPLFLYIAAASSYANIVFQKYQRKQHQKLVNIGSPRLRSIQG